MEGFRIILKNAKKMTVTVRIAGMSIVCMLLLVNKSELGINRKKVRASVVIVPMSSKRSVTNIGSPLLKGILLRTFAIYVLDASPTLPGVSSAKNNPIKIIFRESVVLMGWLDTMFRKFFQRSDMSNRINMKIKKTVNNRYWFAVSRTLNVFVKPAL